MWVKKIFMKTARTFDVQMLATQLAIIPYLSEFPVAVIKRFPETLDWRSLAVPLGSKREYFAK